MADELVSEYRPLLPALRALGHRADLRATMVGDCRFILAVSGRPTVRVMNRGWVRDDGERGAGPAALLTLFARERAREARRHLARGDAVGMAADALVARGLSVGRVLEVSRRPDGNLTVEYRPWSGPPETAVLTESLEDACRKAAAEFRGRAL